MAVRQPQLKVTLVQLEGDDKPTTKSDRTSENAELAPSGASTGPADPDAFQVLVRPPGNADPEIVAVSKDLSGAEALIQTTARSGYWIHGPGFFDAIRQAINAPLANENQGSQKPLRQFSQDQLSTLMRFANAAIAERQTEIRTALAGVETEAAAYARKRLDASQAQLLTTTMRYIAEADTRSRAIRWLRTSEYSGGAHTFEFLDRDGLGLVKGLFAIWTAYKAVAEKEALLAKAMKESGKEMQ